MPRIGLKAGGWLIGEETRTPLTHHKARSHSSPMITEGAGEVHGGADCRRPFKAIKAIQGSLDPAAVNVPF